MTYTQTAETLMDAQLILKRTKADLKAMFLNNYFGDDQGKFQYQGEFEKNLAYDAGNFGIDEMPGWEFGCTGIEEGGGYITYAVLCYAPDVDTGGAKYSSKATFIIELATE